MFKGSGLRLLGIRGLGLGFRGLVAQALGEIAFASSFCCCFEALFLVGLRFRVQALV